MIIAGLRESLTSRPSALLLLTQLTLLLAYPFLDGATSGRAVLGVVQLVAILLGVAAVRRTPALNWVAMGLGTPATVFAVWEAVAPHTGWVVLVSACLHVPFYGFVSYAMLRYLFQDSEISHDEMFATAAAFTVVAWAFAYLYAAVQVIWPDSFGGRHSWYELLFLSFSTVTNTGLSDIVPVQEHARSVCALEEVAGVFYIALVVSRLVGITRRRSS